MGSSSNIDSRSSSNIDSMNSSNISSVNSSNISYSSISFNNTISNSSRKLTPQDSL